MSHTLRSAMMAKCGAHLLFVLAAGLAACGQGSDAGPAMAAAPAPAVAAAPAPPGPSYRVLNLSSVNAVEPVQINARGQTGFSILESPNYVGKFFDGATTRDIGSLGGGSTLVRSLNDNGQLVGGSTKANGRYHAFRWSAACCMQDLGTLGGVQGREYSEAFDINNRGQIVGLSSTDLPFNPNHAFLWDVTSGMRDLGTLTTVTGGGSNALAINEGGQVTGDFDFAIETTHAFVWTASGGMVDLGTLGGPNAFAVDINDAGLIVGNSNPTTDRAQLHAFVWDPRSGMLDLGTLGGTESNAAAMNNSGKVVGIAAGTDGFGHAFLWSRSGGMIDLGTLGGPVSRANAINARGEVAGLSQLATGGEHAFIWSVATGMVDLNTRIKDAPAGLVLTSALAVSNSGAILVASNAGLVLLTPTGR